jgi:tRNA dimethylallyltransferase
VLVTEQGGSVDREKPLVVLLGPTGSGKSDLALSLAEHFAGEIVNCDSVQVYTGLDIGSAKLPTADRRGILHHLIDVADGAREFNAGDYSREARDALAEIASRKTLPIVCGGTGLYLRALLCGLSPAPARDRDLRARLNRIAELRPSTLHRLLKARDAAAASRIHPNDMQKLTRALEITYLAGEATSTVQNRPRNPLCGYRILKIGLNPDRRQLYERLDRRSAAIFGTGIVEETTRLLSAGYQADSKALQSLGYRQALKLIHRQMTQAEALRECQTKTRQYAKRQITWFRAEKNVHWVPAFGDLEWVRAEARSLVTDFLAA